MDPKGPSQPPLDTAYETAGNPTDHTLDESRKAQRNAQSNDGSMVDQRERGDVPLPSTHNEAPANSSLAYGVRDASKDHPEKEWGASNTEGQQMATLGEGRVADAQDHKTGFATEGDFASDLDRKKAEQADLRNEVKEERRENIDIGGALGGRGGPAVVEGRDNGAA